MVCQKCLISSSLLGIFHNTGNVNTVHDGVLHVRALGAEKTLGGKEPLKDTTKSLNVIKCVSL
jgi:hypothetical protein